MLGRDGGSTPPRGRKRAPNLPQGGASPLRSRYAGRRDASVRMCAGSGASRPQSGMVAGRSAFGRGMGEGPDAGARRADAAPPVRELRLALTVDDFDAALAFYR